MRKVLREYVQSIEALHLDPMTAAHGMGHNLAGFDVSRSLGLGKIIPGTDVVKAPGNNVNENVGMLALDMMGPAGSFLKFGLNYAFGNKAPAEALLSMPGGLGNIYNAYYWSQHGVKNPMGANVVHDLETNKLRDPTAVEIAGKALGFNPTAVSQNREMDFEQYEVKVYWQSRRRGLVEAVNVAIWKKDKEAQAKAMAAVRDFNSSIPPDHKELRLTGRELQLALNKKRQERIKMEQNKAPQKRFQSSYDEVEESYAPP